MSTTPTKKNRAEQLTDRMVGWLVEQMESGAADGTGWKMPWHKVGTDQLRPTNVKTGNPYRGGNRWALAMTAMMLDLPDGTWGTFNQWRDAGHPIRKRERALAGIAVPIERKSTERDTESGEEVERGYLMFRQVPVFHSSQVDGWQVDVVTEDGPEPIEHAAEMVEAWRAAGMVIEHGGNRAYYSPGVDRIRVPHLAQFDDAEHYYSTVAHEASHWTGHSSRLDREFSGRFGDRSYAAEELVAELSAATIAAHLGIESATREDHAQYLAHWVGILKEDPSHLWHVAGKADAAADHLIALADGDDQEQAA